MSNESRKEVAVLLVHWRNRLARTADAHYRISDIHRRGDVRLTIINMIMAISVLFIANSDTTVTALQKFFLGPESALDFPKALISIAGLANVLTATYQYVRNYKESAISHKQAGSDFSNLKRKIERHLCSDTYDSFLLHSINRDYNNIGRAYRAVDRKTWHRKEETDVFVQDDIKSKEKLDKVMAEIMGEEPPRSPGIKQM